MFGARFQFRPAKRWIGGNKRTATHLTDRFLKLNGLEIIAPAFEILELVYAIEADRWKADEIVFWLRTHTRPFKTSI